MHETPLSEMIKTCRRIPFVHLSPKPDACDHDFAGWRNFEDGNGGEQVCTKCGMGAMSHSLRTVENTTKGRLMNKVTVTCDGQEEQTYLTCQLPDGVKESDFTDPLPGSEAAFSRGCTCPIQYRWPHALRFALNCPLHQLKHAEPDTH